MRGAKTTAREKVLWALAGGPRTKSGLSHIRAKHPGELDRTLEELIAEELIFPPRGYALRPSLKDVAMLIPCPRCGKKVGECLAPDGTAHSSYIHRPRERLAETIVGLFE